MSNIVTREYYNGEYRNIGDHEKTHTPTDATDRPFILRIKKLKIGDWQLSMHDGDVSISGGRWWYRKTAKSYMDIIYALHVDEAIERIKRFQLPPYNVSMRKVATQTKFNF